MEKAHFYLPNWEKKDQKGDQSPKAPSELRFWLGNQLYLVKPEKRAGSEWSEWSSNEILLCRPEAEVKEGMELEIILAFVNQL